MQDDQIIMRHKGRPRIGPDLKAPETTTKGLLAQAIKVDGKNYEQRYTRCGKKCSTCDTDSEVFQPNRPGHGPYWYFVFIKKDGRTSRRYVGKELKIGYVPAKPKPKPPTEHPL